MQFLVEVEFAHTDSVAVLVSADDKDAAEDRAYMAFLEDPYGDRPEVATVIREAGAEDEGKFTEI